MPRQSLGPRLVRRKGKPNLYIRYIDVESGKQVDRSTGTASSEEAQEQLAEFLGEQRQVRSGPAKPPHRVMIIDVLNRYDAHMIAIGRNKRFLYSLAHLLDFWGNMTVSEITPAQINQYILKNVRHEQRNVAGRARGTVRRELSDLRSAVSFAVNERQLQPIAFPKLPKDGAPRERVVTLDEFNCLLSEAEREYRTAYNLKLFLTIAFYTGARREAIMDLTWDDISFSKNTIDFRIPDTGEELVNRKPRALTPMARPLRDVLLERFTSYEKTPVFVFHEKHNCAVKVDSIYKGLVSVANRCGLKGITPHTFRHTCASTLLNKGVSPLVVDEFLAMSPATQKKHYHHSDRTQVNIAAMLLE